MKAFNHDNVNEFVGVCINLLDVYVVTGHCQKCSLQVRFISVNEKLMQLPQRQRAMRM